jgi:hypothetical protein
MKTILSFFLAVFTIASFGQATKTDSEKLVGKWVSLDAGYAMELDFKTNGSGVVDGDIVTWSVKPGSLILVTDGEKQAYTLSFNDTGFRVSGGNLDMPLNFKKLNSVSTSAAPANSKPKSEGKNLDQTLVGKWCYVNVASNYSTSSEQCIIVNANGTYEYSEERSTSGSNGSSASQSSDAGTWWVENSRVYYNSQNQGEGSYELVKRNHPKTGDPMIVLDGNAYVTFYKKSPW